MQSLKSFLLEGLIQAAILLSLCGLRVEVGVEPERSLLERGPTSALPPVVHTHLHNLRNSLEDERTALHPKNPDLDQFFTSRRLLGWVRSLDRLQVPQTELEAWLVQQDTPPHPVRLLHGAPDRLILPQQTRDSRDHDPLWEEPAGEWEEPIEEAEYGHAQVEQQDDDETADGDVSSSETQKTEGTEDWEEGGARDRTQTEEEQNSESLQECLRLLESFPLAHQQEERECDPRPPSTETHPTAALGRESELEQHWQDLLDLMEPQSSELEMLNLLEQPEVPQAEPGRPLMDEYLQHDSAEAPGQLLPLVPSAQLDVDDGPPHPSLPPPPPPASAPLSLLPEDLPPSLLLDELLEDTDMLEELGLLELDLQDEDFAVEMTQRLQDEEEEEEEEEGSLDTELTRRTSRLSLSTERNMESEEKDKPGDGLTCPPDVADELDSDSGLSLDFSHSPASPSNSEASSYSSSSSSSSSSASSPSPSGPSPMELEVTIKEEPLDEEEEEQLGAVGGHYYPQQDSKHLLTSSFYQNRDLFNGLPWLQQVSHDHTYNQPSQVSPKVSSKHFNAPPKVEKPFTLSKHMWSRDERRARTLKIPISNELIVNLPVEDFNELLTSYRLDEDQLNLIRDIRRRGKNKIAAQNCRKRKMDTLVGLERDVTMLRRRRSQLLREKQEALRTLRELKQRVTRTYHEVFSALRDSQGRPLDVNEFLLSFESDGSVEVVSRRQRVKEKSGRKKEKK